MDSLAQHHPCLIEAGNGLLNATQVRSLLARHERAVLILPTRVILAQLGDQILQTAVTRLDEKTRLLDIAPRDNGMRVRRC